MKVKINIFISHAISNVILTPFLNIHVVLGFVKTDASLLCDSYDAKPQFYVSTFEDKSGDINFIS